MNLKTILTTSLLVVIILSTFSFGFLTYGIYNDAVSAIGSAIITKHKVIFYVMAALHVVTFGLGGAVFYKA